MNGLEKQSASLETLKELIKANKPEEYSLKPLAIKELIKFKEKENVVNLIIDTVNAYCNDSLIKIVCIDILGEVRSESAIGVLSKLADDPLWPVREEAVIACGKIGSRDAIQILISKLVDIKDTVQRAAARSLNKTLIDKIDKNELLRLIPFILNSDPIIRSNIAEVLNKSVSKDETIKQFVLEELKKLASKIKTDDRKLSYLLMEIGKFPSLSTIFPSIDLGLDREGHLLKLLTLGNRPS